MPPLDRNFDARLSPFIARRGMRTVQRSHTRSADIPIFRSFANDRPPRDRGRLHIENISERKHVNHRTHLGSDPYSRRSREKPVCSHAADTHGRIGLLPSLPPASHAASRRDANRITERIVVGTSWARPFFLTDRLLQQITISDHLGSRRSLGSLKQGEDPSCTVMLQIHGAERSRKVFLLVFNARCN